MTSSRDIRAMRCGLASGERSLPSRCTGRSEVCVERAVVARRLLPHGVHPLWAFLVVVEKSSTGRVSFGQSAVVAVANASISPTHRYHFYPHPLSC
eukprot:scaffold83479_cov66-Phaeocystis_antarctica.AAC.2